ncbi:hypothetical protein NE237_031415 [Protea cynaroides]|uniref:Phytocyanin domain-containing protein n=1 Tax=Protea cynaroides TaxID=273540 RepID=A0A9Q0R249_9MAGN|nr:hypothetical protein NE237_031415 [Protea cynaroides]
MRIARPKWAPLCSAPLMSVRRSRSQRLILSRQQRGSSSKARQEPGRHPVSPGSSSWNRSKERLVSSEARPYGTTKEFKNASQDMQKLKRCGIPFYRIPAEKLGLEMAMSRALLNLAVTAILVEFAMGANCTVGGTNGWDLTSNLQAWAAAQSFHVGDNLIFQYSPPHNVLEVTKANYDSCQATSTRQAHTDGNTVIRLTKAGKRYFTCGVPGHCSQGMKLQVRTLATSASTPPSPAMVTSPSTLPTVAPPPLPDLATPLPAIEIAPALPNLATPPLPSTETLAPFIPPSLAPLGSLPDGLPPILPSVESPAASASATTTPSPPSTSSANRGHLLSKLLIIGICFGITMLQAF